VPILYEPQLTCVTHLRTKGTQRGQM
jgi:hypothetical protein